MNQIVLLRISMYVLGVAMGALASGLVGAYWLNMTPAWLTGLLGGAFGFIGVFLGENIGDALVFSFVSTILLGIFLWQVSGLLMLKGIVSSIIVGLCTGKLVGGLWKEVVT
jgi:hypothetical protein